MKNLLLFFALIVSFLATAQPRDTGHWSPAGAVWVYRVPAQFARPYMKFQYNGDTIIQNINTKKMNCYAFEYVGASSSTLQRTPDQYLDTKFMYNSNDTLFILVRDTFRTLYVFSAQVGDSWEITETGDYSVQNVSLPTTDFVTVTSINSFTIAGKTFDELAISGGSSWRIGSILLKNIGGTETFLPLPIPPNNEEVICDASSLMNGLVCYYDNTRGMLAATSNCTGIMTYQPPTDTTNVEIVTENHQINCFPNPTFSQVTIDIQHQTNTTIHYLRIYNSVGQVMSIQKITNQQTIDISYLSAGTYLFLIENSYFSKTFKIIKL
jgi:Secretion system C-terminal sorting domain